MKKYTTEMIKLLALAIVTPILVAAYTKVESSVSKIPVDQTQGGVTGATPVSVGLMDNTKSTDADLNTENNDYFLVRSVVPSTDGSANTNNRKPLLTTDGVALIVL